MCFQLLTSKTRRVIGSGASVALTSCPWHKHLVEFIPKELCLPFGWCHECNECHLSDWIPTILSMKYKSHELEEQASVVTVVNRWINHLKAPQELLILFAR